MKSANFHDRRAFAAQSHHGYDTRARSLEHVTGICLHQAACDMGEDPHRYDTMGAHLGITRAGHVVWLHAFDRLVVHGNGWNAGTIGIEISGLYAGIEGDASTVWDNPGTTKRETGQVLTAEAIAACQETIRWICSQLPQVKALVSHRQASASRRSDPGQAVWRAIALPVAAELALTDGGPGFTLGDGLPIPREWDPRSTYRY